MHAVFILNSSAGSSGHGDLQRRIAETCAKTGTEHELVTCDRGDCIRDAARRALKSGAGLIVAAGGDGTISTVASVIAGSGVPLGVIPCGTLNHFAKDAGIPVDEELAIRTILTGTACDVDAAEVNGRIFLNNCSIGLYAHIVEQRTAGQNRGLAKWWAFVRAILDVLWRYPTIHVELRAVGEELRCTTPLVFIGNNLYEFEGLQAGTR
ncbi:MAG TPA: diacylglycerol kinase family protein, partial [Terriglobales bacterium]|nr:diacylglycerol kinase family protein [Terriglobales bacterium]